MNIVLIKWLHVQGDKYGDESQKMLRRVWRCVSSGRTDSTVTFQILPAKLSLWLGC